MICERIFAKLYTIILVAKLNMKVAYITAGAAGMYCGTCIHDNTVATSTKKTGT